MSPLYHLSWNPLNVIIRLCEIVISKFKISKGWLEDINCDMEVNKECPFSPTFFFNLCTRKLRIFPKGRV